MMRVVVRPHRAVVIRHRIVARLAARQRADAPAAETVAVEQRGGDAPRPLGRRDAGEQGVAGIGRAHAARTLGAVEGQRIGAEVVAPERSPRSGARSASASSQSLSARPASPKCAASLAAALLGREHVGLHLAQRDRPRGAGAVGVEDRIVAVLPALIDEALLVGAVVFHEAVAVGVAELVDPGQRRLDVRPDGADRLDVARPVEIGARQHDERASNRRCRSRGGTAPRPAWPSRRAAARAGSCPAVRRRSDRCGLPGWPRDSAARRGRSTGPSTASSGR